MRTYITETALLRRINRKLARNHQAIRKCRSKSRWFHSLGDYYLIDSPGNSIIDTHVNLESYGRELNALADCERLRQP